MHPSHRPHASNRLRQERMARNWRQRDLAEHLGTTIVSVTRWERGIQEPSAYFRLKLCALFGKSAQELGLAEVHSAPPANTQEALSETGSGPSSEAEAPGLWTVPYRRNPHFTGREDLLDQLVRQLAWEQAEQGMARRQAVLSQPQAIKGLGGIGKTQIALEYAYRSRLQGRYTHTFWINAGSEEAILTSFQALAAQLPSFAARDEQDQHQLIAATLRWLEQCPHSWLLIVDNADDVSLVQPYLPLQGQGSILLTTRAHAVAALATAIEVDQMSLVEGTQLLLHRSRRLQASEEQRHEACTIVLALDGFPLALDQAGAYLEETGCSFGDYQEIYEQHRARLLARRGRQTTHYPDSVATTWDLSFQKVEQVHPAAAELLRLCAFLSPDHIPEELLTEAAAQWPAVLQQAVADRFSFNELIEALLAFSLVKRLAQEHLLSLHRLVQVVLLDRMEPEEQHVWAERVVRAVHMLFPADPKGEVESWPECLRYLEQAQACERLIQQHRLCLPEAAELLERVGIYLREHASYALAESFLQRALSIAEQQFGAEHLQASSPLLNLGNLSLVQGKYEVAEALLQRAVQIREQALGLQHPQVATPLNTLGNLYREQGNYEQAEAFYQRAMHIWEQALGPHHPQVATPLLNLGNLSFEQGKYEVAEALLQRALSINEQALDPAHPQLAYPLNNLGALYREQGKYEVAEALLQRALYIWEQALGPHHPSLAYPLDNLGKLSFEQGKYEQAERFLQRALQIREQGLGPHHLQVAEPLQTLGNLARDQGQDAQAEAFYQRALSIQEQHLGPEHLDLAETLQDLARLRQMQQQDAEAILLYQQSLAMREQALGANHPKTSQTRERLQAVLGALGKTEEVAALEGAQPDHVRGE